MRGTTTWTPRSMRKEVGRSAGATIPLWLMVRWQAEPLQSLEVNGAESHLQPIENPTLKPKKTMTLREACPAVLYDCEDYSPWNAATVVGEVHGDYLC